MTNSDIALIWLLPAATELVAPQHAPTAVALLFPLGFTLLCQLAIQRFLPRRTPAWLIGLFMVAWAVAGLPTFLGLLWVPHYG